MNVLDASLMIIVGCAIFLSLKSNYNQSIHKADRVVVFVLFCMFCFWTTQLLYSKVLENESMMLVALLLLAYALLFLTLSYLSRKRRDGVGTLHPCSDNGKDDRKDYYICLALVLLFATAFSMYQSLFSFPIAEGWYTTYAKLINASKIPYKDFEFLFMPAYLYLIALITRLFGYDIIVLRMFGVVLFSCIGAASFAMFRKIFSNWLSCMTAVVAIYFLQSEVVQVFYDYIRVYDLCVFLSCLLMLNSLPSMLTREKRSRIEFITQISCGFFASCSFLVRQNSGALVLVFYGLFFTFLLIYSKTKGFVLRNLAHWCFGAVIPLAATALYFMVVGDFSSFINSTVDGAIKAKGGMMTVLFGWIPRWIDTLPQSLWYCAVFFLLLIGGSCLRKKDQRGDCSHVNKSFFAICVAFLCTLAAGFVICYISQDFATIVQSIMYIKLPDLAFLCVIIIFAWELYMLLLHRHPQKNHLWHVSIMLLSGLMVTLGYGSGMSAGLSEGQTGLAVGFLFGLLLYTSNHRLGTPVKLVCAFLALFVCLGTVAAKTILPYSWWGLQESSIYECKESVDIAKLKGIRVSPQTKQGIEAITDALVTYSQEDEPVFVFPHIPIFYTLANRFPSTYTYVQWFDVASYQSILDDIDRLKADPPKVLVHVPDAVISAHETLFMGSRDSALSLMSQALEQMEQSLPYELVSSFIVQKYPVSIYRLADEYDPNITYDLSTDDADVSETENKDMSREAVVEPSQYFKGTGTQEDPYLISSVMDLENLSSLVNNGNDMKGVYFKQTAELDFSNVQSFTPIGLFDSGQDFYGTYDGDGHAIHHITIDQTDFSGNNALFAQLGGTVMNLGIESGNISGNCCGSIASHAAGAQARIINCYNKATISGNRAGGIVDNFSGYVDGCINMGYLDAATVGGICSYSALGVTNSFYTQPVTENKNSGYGNYVTMKQLEACLTETNENKRLQTTGTDLYMTVHEDGSVTYQAEYPFPLVTFLEKQIPGLLLLALMLGVWFSKRKRS